MRTTSLLSTPGSHDDYTTSLDGAHRESRQLKEHTRCRDHPLLVLMEDEMIHTDDHPFCSIDPTCGCHEDSALIAEVHEAVEQGLITPAEATLIIQGKTL